MKKLFVVATLLLAAFPMAAVAGPYKIVVRNSTTQEVGLTLKTAQGKTIYNPVTLKPGDRYELNNADAGVAVFVTSAKCGALRTDLGNGDWTVDIRPTAQGCELAKSSKSPK
jgi:hypothetical protein